MTEARTWRNGHVSWAWPAGFYVFFGLLWTASPDRDPVGLALGVAAFLFAAALVVLEAPARVMATDEALLVRGPGWRTTRVPWQDVVDIRPRRDRRRSRLVVVTSDGRELRTRLPPVDHPTLPCHWRERTGRAPSD